MADERDDIRSRIDIVELIGQKVALKRAGKHFKGLCPFHQDRNPSFIVDPTTGRYKCWSCGESGDVFTWVMKTQNVDFVDALKELADRAGVQLTQRGTPVPPSVRDAQKRAMTESLAYFREQVTRSTAALNYCERRGISPEVMSTWELGYAPDVGDALASQLRKSGLSLADCKTLFLVDEDARGGYYDRFRGRLMFPIRDEKGELVAFGGRLLGDGNPKYINSSDTPLYRKSRVLYGMNRAKDTWSKGKRAVLVEGYLDVIACHTAGLTEAVASLGTALSEEHAKLMKRWVEEVVVLYDSDEAGQKATERAIEVLETEKVRVRIALMPKGEDPDTLLKSRGIQALQATVTDALRPLDYRFHRLDQKKTVDDPSFWDDAVTILSSAASNLDLEKHLVRLAAQYPGLRDPRAAQDRLRKMITAAQRGQRAPERAVRPSLSPEHRALSEPLTTGEFVLLRALHEVKFQRYAWMWLRQKDLLVTQTAIRVAEAVVQAFPAQPPEGVIGGWLHQIDDEEVRQMLSDISLDFRAKEELTEEMLADQVERMKRQYEQRTLLRLRQNESTAQERQQILERLRRLSRKPTDVTSTDADPFA